MLLRNREKYRTQNYKLRIYFGIKSAIICSRRYRQAFDHAINELHWSAN